MEGCSQLKSTTPPEVSTESSVKKGLFTENYEDVTNDGYEVVPENQLGIIGIDDSWDFESILMNDENGAKATDESAGYVQPSVGQSPLNVI